MDMHRKMRKYLYDVGIMSVLMITGLLFYFVFIPAQIKLRAAWGGTTNFSSRTFPNLLMIALCVCAVIGLVKALAGYVGLRAELQKQGAMQASRPLDRHAVFQLLAPYIAYAVILLYCILFKEVGYVFATLLVPPILMFVLGCRSWVLYLSTYAFGAILFVVFKVLMNVPLP